MAIISTKEYEAVPCSKIASYMRGGSAAGFALSIRPETLASKYLQFEKRGLRGGGYEDCIVPTALVGLIPINDDVSLWVEPKVPISNLDYIVKTFGGIVPDHFACLRGYMRSETTADNVQEFITRSFVRTVSELRSDGVLRQYERHEDANGSLAGRINYPRTFSTYFTRGISYRVASSRFDKTADNEANRCLVYALDYLVANADCSAAYTAELFDLLTYFEHSVGMSRITIRPDFDSASRSIPRTRPGYLNALVLAQTITSGQSIDLSSHSGELVMSNLAIDMSKTFENYMRTILTRDRGFGWEAVDGNELDPPVRLYEKGDLPSAIFEFATDASETTRGIDIKPDILIKLDGGGFIVADAKYKPIGESISANRQDIEQVVTYAERLRARYALTVHPCANGQAAGLYYSGSIGAVNVFCYRFDLASSDMKAEERAFYDAINLLAMN